MWVVEPSAPTDKTQDDTLKHTGGASLRDQALAKLVQSMLSSPQENMGLLDEPMRFPGFQGALRNQLFTVKDELFQSAAAPGLLRAAWAGETLLDWSRFDGLSSETMMAALQGPELNDARELILCPNWSNTTPLALAQAICSFPHLQDLFILAAPGRAEEGPIGEFYTALAAEPGCPKGKIFLSDAASCAIKQRLWLPTAETVSSPSSFPIQQLLVVPPKRQSQQSIPSINNPVYYFPLVDAFLTPTRCVNGILSLLACNMAHGNLEPDMCSLSVSHLFSRAAPTLDDQSAIAISPMPAETFTIAKRVYHLPINNCFGKMRDLTPSTWTVLINLSAVQEPQHPSITTTSPLPPQKLFQCAFVRPRNKVIKAEPMSSASFGPDDLEVLGLEDFVRVAAPEEDTESLSRRLDHIERRAAALSRQPNPTNPANPPRISRAPIDAQTAYGLLAHAVNRLPVVHASYQLAMLQQNPTPDRFWYPELGLAHLEPAPYHSSFHASLLA